MQIILETGKQSPCVPNPSTPPLGPPTPLKALDILDYPCTPWSKDGVQPPTPTNYQTLGSF